MIIGKKGLVPQRQFIMEQWKEGTHMRKTILHMEEKNEKLINEKLIKLKNQRGFN